MARHIRRVENYTNAALIMGLVNLLWVLTAIWVNWGLMALILTTLLLNHLITLLDRHLHSRHGPRP